MKTCQSSPFCSLKLCRQFTYKMRQSRQQESRTYQILICLLIVTKDQISLSQLIIMLYECCWIRICHGSQVFCMNGIIWYLFLRCQNLHLLAALMHFNLFMCFKIYTFGNWNLQSPYVEAPQFPGAEVNYNFPMPAAPPGAHRHL